MHKTHLQDSTSTAYHGGFCNSRGFHGIQTTREIAKVDCVTCIKKMEADKRYAGLLRLSRRAAQ